MIGLIKKDLILIVKSISAIYIIGVGVPLFVVTQNPKFGMPILALLIAFVFAMQVSTTMSLDEGVKWRRNVTAMPISAFSEAASKYVLTVLLAILSSIVVLVLGITIGSRFFSIGLNVTNIYTFLSFAIVLLYNSIIIPTTYKYGSAKSKYFLMLFLALPVIAPYLFKFLGVGIRTDIYTTQVGVLIMVRLVIFVFVLMLISLIISTIILKKRDYSIMNN